MVGGEGRGVGGEEGRWGRGLVIYGWKLDSYVINL